MGKDASGATGAGMGSNHLGVNGAEAHVPMSHPDEIHFGEVSHAEKCVTTGFNPKNLGNYPKGSDKTQ